jgi:hypothetical protein
MYIIFVRFLLEWNNMRVDVGRFLGRQLRHTLNVGNLLFYVHSDFADNLLFQSFDTNMKGIDEDVRELSGKEEGKDYALDLYMGICSF